MRPVIKRFPDGTYAKVFVDGSWFLRLANGKHVRGREHDAPEAHAVATKIHTEFVMQAWATGRFKAGGVYQVQLSKEVVR